MRGVRIVAAHCLLWCLALLPLLGWSGHTLAAWQTRGLFSWLGFDYAYFSAAALALVHRGPPAIYDAGAIAFYSERFTAYYVGPGRPLIVPPPWPPVFFVLLTPFAVLPPPIGFATWTAVNLGMAAHVANRLAAPFRSRRAVELVAIGFAPVVYTLFFGQPSILWMYALYQACRSFARGADLRAGLWSGALLIKPQYALFLALALAYKARWAALAGMALAGLGLLVSTVLLLGPSGTRVYIDSVRSLTGFRVAESLIAPEQMISWRGFLLNVLPSTIGEQQGMIITVALSALTASVLLLIWRGPWQPQRSRFAAQLLATMLVTMLASFHNHTHGATLLLVPAMLLAAQRQCPPPLRWLMWLYVVLPPLVFLPSNDAIRLSTTFVILMTVTLYTLVVYELGGAFREAATPYDQAPGRARPSWSTPTNSTVPGAGASPANPANPANPADPAVAGPKRST